MKTIIIIIILGLVFYSCQKDKLDNSKDDTINNSLIQGEGSISFQRIIGGDYGSDLLTSVKQTSDSGYIFCGYTEYNAANGMDILVLKTNSKGETTWLNTFSYNNNDIGQKIIITKDSGFVILATSQACGGWGTEFFCPMDIILLKFSNNAVLEWENTFKFDSWVGLSNFYQTSDGGFVLCYNKTISESFELQGTILKTDKNGQKLWEKEIPLMHCYDCSITEEGVLIICGRNEQGELSLVKTKPDGDTLWTKAIGEYPDYRVFSIVEISNGYALCGNYVLEPYVELGFAMVLDADGNELWKKYYFNNGIPVNVDDPENSIYRSLDAIIATNDKNLVAIGINADGNGDINTYGHLMKITLTNGDVLWEKEFNPGKHNGLREIQQTNDDGYITIGSSDGNGYIIKTDKNGY